MEVKIKDGVRVLNQLMAELLISCRAFDIYKYMPKLTNDWSDMTRTAFNSTNMNSVILALCKWLEFYKEYSQVIPESVKTENKELCKKLEKLKITEFRNKFIGHIKNKETGRPLTVEEAEERYQKITSYDRDKFILWLHSPSSSSSVIGLWERTRDKMNEGVRSNKQSQQDSPDGSPLL